MWLLNVHFNQRVAQHRKMLLDNGDPMSYGEAMVGLDSKMARGHIIRERIHI